jgi:hypothetical protein
MTQYDLPQKAGIHPCRGSEMERGQRPIGEIIVQILELELADVSSVRPK